MGDSPRESCSRFHASSVALLNFTLIICVKFEDVHESDRPLASYSSGVAGAATNGLNVLPKDA